jgi:bifunctional DNA-binding transcriptional regulator/antitoxin component of YhaV-PrlF toxin-antitoxin module
MTTMESTTKIIRPLQDGQITIPSEFRQRLKIDEATALQIRVEGDELRIKPLHSGQSGDDPDWYERLYEHFAPARAEAIERGYTEDEINDVIDAAVAAVRVERA